MSMALPRQQFGVLQSKMYPVYFRAVAYCTGMSWLGLLLGEMRSLWSDKDEMFQGCYNLLLVMGMVLITLHYLRPRASKVMFERMKEEKEEGGRRDPYLVLETTWATELDVVSAVRPTDRVQVIRREPILAAWRNPWILKHDALGTKLKVLIILMTLISGGMAADSRPHKKENFGDIITFPLFGSEDLSLRGTFFTKIRLGNPPQELNMLVDTGSDLFWVNGPSYDMKNVSKMYKTEESDTASLVNCSQEPCTFEMNYYDKGSISGFYVRDVLHYDTFFRNSDANMSTKVEFGYRYQVALESITINGDQLPVDPRVFYDTTLDSGAKRSLLEAETYDLLLKAVSVSMNQSSYLGPRGLQCYQVSASETFPDIHFEFHGGASLTLKPTNYLLENVYDGKGGWCLGFVRKKSITILGAPALSDKLVVYDLNLGRIGWGNRDCSKPVNVSLTYDVFSPEPAASCAWDLGTTSAVMATAAIIFLVVHSCLF